MPSQTYQQWLAAAPPWVAVAEDTTRLPVPGGWLYQVLHWSNGGGYQPALSFVPDPNAPHVNKKED